MGNDWPDGWTQSQSCWNEGAWDPNGSSNWSHAAHPGSSVDWAEQGAAAAQADAVPASAEERVPVVSRLDDLPDSAWGIPTEVAARISTLDDAAWGIPKSLRTVVDDDADWGLPAGTTAARAAISAPAYTPPPVPAVHKKWPEQVSDWMARQEEFFPGESPLPRGWIRALSRTSGKTYYFRASDMTTTFEITEVFQLNG